MITITIDYEGHRKTEEYKVSYFIARSLSRILYALTNKEPEKTFDDYMDAVKRD